MVDIPVLVSETTNPSFGDYQFNSSMAISQASLFYWYCCIDEHVRFNTFEFLQSNVLNKLIFS